MASNDKLIRIIVRAEDQMSTAMNSMASRLENTGRKMRNVGAGMTAAITAPVVGLGAAALKAYAGYEDVMTEIQARTQATADEMDAMSAQALKMGSDTKFSATEAAQAMLELTSSGSDAAEAMEQLPAVLDLAAAGALDLKTAADGVTDVLSMFNMEARDSQRVVDALAKASGSSSATVNDLMQAMQNVGPIAAQMGMNVDQTAAALAVFAENGIKGSEAGTNLRSMLLNMTRDTTKVQETWHDLGVSMYDAQGNMRDLDAVFKDLNAAMAGMSMEEQNRIAANLAGSYGLIGFNSLRAANGISDMETRMSDASSASTIADARMSTLSGRFTSLMGSLETLGITLGGLTDGPLNSFLIWATDAVNAMRTFAETNPRIAQGIMVIVGLLAALGPVLMIAGQLTMAFSALMPVLTAIGGVLAGLSLPIAALIAAIGGLIYILVRFGHRLEGLKMIGVAVQAAFNRLVHEVGQLMQRLRDAFQGDSILERVQNLGMEIGHVLLDALRLVAPGFYKMGQAIMEGLVGGIKSQIGNLVAAATDAASNAADAVRRAFRIRSPSRVMMEIGEQVVAGFNEGVASMGGIGVNTPQVRSMAASVGGGNVTIGAIHVPPGTSREQIEYISREIAKRARQRGARGDR